MPKSKRTRKKFRGVVYEKTLAKVKTEKKAKAAPAAIEDPRDRHKEELRQLREKQRELRELKYGHLKELPLQVIIAFGFGCKAFWRSDSIFQMGACIPPKPHYPQG